MGLPKVVLKHSLNSLEMRKKKLNYGQVRVADLPTSRRGKHHDLLNKILDDLKDAPSGSAVQIPLDQVGGIGLANLRSAVSRATRANNMKVETRSDQRFFYVWKITGKI